MERPAFFVKFSKTPAPRGKLGNSPYSPDNSPDGQQAETRGKLGNSPYFTNSPNKKRIYIREKKIYIKEFSFFEGEWGE